MNDDDNRPIEREDFWRAYQLVHAVQAYVQSEDQSLIETLRWICEDSEAATTPHGRELLMDPVPERALQRELKHASLLLDALGRGQTMMPKTIGTSLTPCALPGCPELVEGGIYCLDHELDRGLEE